MPDAVELVRSIVAAWDGTDPAGLEASAKRGDRGTLVSVVAVAPHDADAEQRRRRWFAARALYVDDASGDIFRVPQSEATPARMEALVADPKRRDAARLTPEEMT
jgi:hypothetical protein